MLEALSIIFPVSLDDSLANDMFSKFEPDIEAIHHLLDAVLNNAIDQEKSVIEQYEARIAACDIVRYAVGLNDPLTPRILKVKAYYNNELNKIKSTFCYKIKNFFGLI